VLEGLLPYLPGAAQDALFERLHEISPVGSQIAAGLGPEPGELPDFAEGARRIPQLASQPPVTDLWYDDARRNTKEWLAERGWNVTAVDLVNKAANEYCRPLDGLPSIFERLMREKFFTARRMP
jgi:O-methyltransferase involved in polyketide biosynthesis